MIRRDWEAEWLAFKLFVAGRTLFGYRGETIAHDVHMQALDNGRVHKGSPAQTVLAQYGITYDELPALLTYLKGVPP